MSAFTETAFSKKLSDLNSSQQSIQTLSLWLIHHRKHHESIVKTWLRELETVHEGRKLTFMYLANDVIQNSKKKGPEYGKEFAKHLPKAFSHIGTSCKSERLIGSLGRMLCIWEERGVYDSKQIEEYRSRLNKEFKDANHQEGKAKANGDGNGNGNGDSAGTPNHQNNKNGDSSSGGGGADAVAVSSGNSNSKSHDKSEKRKTDRENRENKHEMKRKHRDESHKNDSKSRRKHEKSGDSSSKRTQRSPNVKEQHTPENGSGGGNGDLSPYVPLGEPPEPEDLIKALINIENSASSDVVVRERIAKLPPEISEMSCLAKLEDKDAAKELAKQVNEAVELLNDYNARLAAEMEERSKLASMLRDFQAEQKELLAQAERSLEEHKKKLNNVCAVQKEIRDHLSNLPDMTQLPDVTELAPLPSAGDLFNIH